MKRERLIHEASKIWAPDFPRRVSSDKRMQTPVGQRERFVSLIMSAEDAGMPGYSSVYSFPRGHSDQQNIPRVDTLFIDFDISDGDYDPENPSLSAWRRDVSQLLTRIRMIARKLEDEDRARHWRASLSGHKGVHLFLDFPEVHVANGSFYQFKNGLREYSKGVVDWLNHAAQVDVSPWVDVDSADLARLVRHPNTRHHGVRHVDEAYCVPVTIQELAEITPDEYLSLTSQRRELPEGLERVESERAGQRVSQLIRTAQGTASSRSRGGKASGFNPQAVDAYESEANQNISVEDLKFLTRDKPCIWKFRSRPDAYAHGAASRAMEVSVMKELISLGAPIEVMVEFFSPIPRFDEDWTRDMLTDLIGRQYSGFVCEKVWLEGPQFCLGPECSIYRRSDDDFKSYST